MTTARDRDRVRWDERYASDGCVWGAEPNQKVAEFAAQLEVGSVLDLGCGQGRNAIWLARQGHHVTALDLSPVAIEQAKAWALQAGVDIEFRVADLEDWEPEGRTWDFVLLCYLQLPESLRRRAHALAVTSLAPGGKLLLIAHHLENLEHGVSGPPDPGVLYTEAQLRADFAELEIVRCEKVSRHVEREGMRGDAIDVLLIAHRSHD